MAASYPNSAKSFSTLNPGDTIQDTDIEAAYDEVAAIESALLNGLAHDLKFTDATYDIGKSGATRPRDLFLSRNATIGGTVAVTGAATLSSTLAVTGAITERGRSAAQGEWTTPTFAAGNFTASGSMTWTVGSGDVATFAYTLIGKTMLVMISLNTTTVGGTLSTTLNIAIPGGFTAAKRTITPFLLLDNAARTTAYAEVAAGGSVIGITRTDAANLTAATDATAVYGQIAFEVS
jgi:hypothetical protein